MADFESQLSNKGKGKSRFRAKPSRENNPNDTPGLCFFLSKLAAINCVPEFTVPLLALCFVLPAKNISHQKFGIKKQILMTNIYDEAARMKMRQISLTGSSNLFEWQDITQAIDLFNNYVSLQLLSTRPANNKNRFL
jgi:hypothetical protein